MSILDIILWFIGMICGSVIIISYVTFVQLIKERLQEYNEREKLNSK